MNQTETQNQGKIRKKRAARNLGVNIMYQVVSLALGLIIPRLYMTSLGSESSGVLTTIKQIFACLSLLEAGVGTATIQALYRPVVDNDRNAISRILSATNLFYIRTGICYTGCVGALAFLFPLITNSTLSNGTVCLLILMNGFPSVLNFLIHAKYGLLMNAEGRQYVITVLDTVMELVTQCSRIVILILSDSILLIQSIYVFTAIARTLFMVIYFRRHYGWINFRADPDKAAISQSGSVLVHQISGTIYNNTDVVLLSLLCDFKVVNVYTIFNLFFSHVQQLINSVTNSFIFALGQLFHSNMTRFMKLYNMFENTFIMAIFIIYTMMCLYMLPVIQWYTSGITDANYIQPLIVWLFVIIKIGEQVAQPSWQVNNIAGRFRDTRKFSIIEMVANVIVSVIAVSVWGMPGCLIGTIAAMLISTVLSIRFANKEVLHRPVMKTLRYIIGGAAVFAAVMLLKGGVRTMEDPTFLNIAFHAAVDMIWVSALYIGVFFALDPVSAKSVWGMVWNKARSLKNRK